MKFKPLEGRETFYIVAVIVAGVFDYLLNLVASRFLSIENYSTLQSLTSTLLIIGVLAVSLNYTVLSSTSKLLRGGDLKKVRGVRLEALKLALKILFILSLALIIFSAFFVDILKLPVIAILTIFFASGVTLFLTINYGILCGLKSFVYYGIVIVTFSFIKLVIGSAIALKTANPSLVLMSIPIAGTIAFALGWYLTNKKLDRGTQRLKAGSLNKNYSSFLWFILFITLITHLDVICAKTFMKVQEAGLYSGFNVLGKIILALNISFITLALPDAFSTKQKPKGFKAYAFIVGFGLLISFIFTVWPNVSVLLLGEQYRGTSLILSWFGAAATLLSLATLEFNFSRAKGLEKTNILLLVAAILICLDFYVFRNSILNSISILAGIYLLTFLCLYVINLKHEKN